MKVFVDANVFLRSILQDDNEKARHCLKLLEKIDRGEVQAATSMLVLNEILWVLEGLNVGREDIAKRIKAIAMSKVEVLGHANGSAVLESLGYYEELNVDFIDALNACIARESGINDIITYDEHFKKIEFANKIEPQEL